MIDWLIQSAADAPQLAGGLPPAGFLSVAEKAVYDRLSHEKRRKDWLLGRWTAKKLLRDREEKSGNDKPSYRQISILAAQDGAPEIWLEGAERPDRGDFTLSISHSHGVSFCAIAPRSYLLGADIEAVEPRSPRFVEDYFTADERDLVQKASAVSRDLLITTIWSGKEAALKAVRQGLRRDRRSVSCHIPLPVYTSGPQKAQGNWMPFSVYWFGLQENNRQATFFGWWQVWGNFVLTAVVAAEADRCLERLPAAPCRWK